MSATIYVYGSLDGPAPIALPTMVFMGKNLTIGRLYNLESAVVRDQDRLVNATREIQGLIEDSSFRTRIGKAFPFDHVDQAQAFETTPGMRAILAAGT